MLLLAVGEATPDADSALASGPNRPLHSGFDGTYLGSPRLFRSCAPTSLGSVSLRLTPRLAMAGSGLTVRQVPVRWQDDRCGASALCTAVTLVSSCFDVLLQPRCSAGPVLCAGPQRGSLTAGLPCVASRLEG